MHLSDILILSGARTPIGSFGGALASQSPAQLGTVAATSAIQRAGVAAAAVDVAVFGHIITTTSDDVYLARQIALQSGMTPSSNAFQVNRLCGSGLQAIISAAQQLLLGDGQLALCGGAESMSQGAFLLPGVRKGLRVGHAAVTDLTLGILTDPFGSGHMGITAENIAAKYGFSRNQLDEFALESQQRAAKAQQAGYFNKQIVAVPLPGKTGAAPTLMTTDEHIRPGTTLQSLSQLKPAFQANGMVTAGNASGLNDGAAALILATAPYAKSQGLTAKARLVGYSMAGVEPSLMGLGPIPAVQQLLVKTGLSLGNIDVIESNEAFAAQALAVSQTLGFDPAKVNPNGGAIALGHPVGATGAILLVKTLYELERINGQFGLVTLCIGGGQGIALLVERCG
ncbi:acetyl-CoA C-acyltransferase [Rheinheimera riviphila]|uniref:Acetyl-CoA C-acyltransferase n=1 Tax=Rheinheimera riviphila TaxID=1834037 RepID=A0A437QBN1_9GAMM|nr:acetyl-CoA C-acyltransferase [Rheinheimera riviphila]RVU31958.1 acetyl-CoA C-acyltransferase [Rheinheimera riviphila]